jgi:paraquat-inducible protein A
MNTNINNIIECYHCGLFIKNDNKNKNKILKCSRCLNKLINEKEPSLDSLFYAISALMFFVILNIYPIISLSINGTTLKATLFDTVLILLEEGFLFVAVLIFFTIILAPVLNSLIIIFSFIQQYTKLRIFTQTLLHDSFHFFKSWGFLDVFIISIIVTYIKLQGMVPSTQFDLGFYAMLIYIFLFYMSNLKFEVKNVFEN